MQTWSLRPCKRELCGEQIMRWRRLDTPTIFWFQKHCIDPTMVSLFFAFLMMALLTVCRACACVWAPHWSRLNSMAGYYGHFLAYTCDSLVPLSFLYSVKLPPRLNSSVFLSCTFTYAAKHNWGKTSNYTDLSHFTTTLKLALNATCQTYCVCMLSCFSHIRLFAIPCTVACQTPLSMGFSRQEYWSGLPCSPLGDLPGPGNKPMSAVSPAFAGRFFTTSAIWESQLSYVLYSYILNPFTF